MATPDSVAAASPVGSFLAGVGAAFLLKLTSSIDDLIWFAPFLALAESRVQKIWYCSIYVLVCVLVAGAALGLARAAELGFNLAATAINGARSGTEETWEDGEPGAGGFFWDASRVLGVSASAVIFVYALVELRAWIREGHDLLSFFGVRSTSCCRCRSLEKELSLEAMEVEDGNRAERQGDGAQGEAEVVGEEMTNAAATSLMAERGASAATTPPRGEGGDAYHEAGDEDSGDAGDGEGDVPRSARALVAVAVCGTLDDMVLFAAVVAGRGIPWMSVLPGAILAALVILVVCWHATLYPPFANFMKKVPMWTLLAAISVYLLVGSLV